MTLANWLSSYFMGGIVAVGLLVRPKGRADTWVRLYDFKVFGAQDAPLYLSLRYALLKSWSWSKLAKD
jgi:hypothetical protein